MADAMGDMAVVGGVVRANPTPYKERKAAPPKKKTRKGKRKGGDSDDDESTYAPRDVEPFDTKKLRKVSCGKGRLILHDFLLAYTPNKLII